MSPTKMSGKLQCTVQTSQKGRVRKELFLNIVEIDAGCLFPGTEVMYQVFGKYSLQAENI